MKEFYNDFYCSENISISIISSEKLSKLEKYKENKLVEKGLLICL